MPSKEIEELKNKFFDRFGYDESIPSDCLAEYWDWFEQKLKEKDEEIENLKDMIRQMIGGMSDD